MSCDFNTHILVKGTNEELLSVLKALSLYETDAVVNGIDYSNFQIGFVGKISDEPLSIVDDYDGFMKADDLEIIKAAEEELAAYVETLNGKFYVSTGGPFGKFSDLEELRLFENIADAAPNAYSIAIMRGFDSSCDYYYEGELKDGTLYVSEFVYADYWMLDHAELLLMDKDDFFLDDINRDLQFKNPDSMCWHYYKYDPVKKVRFDN